jgi:hypothetical protein
MMRAYFIVELLFERAARRWIPRFGRLKHLAIYSAWFENKGDLHLLLCRGSRGVAGDHDVFKPGIVALDDYIGRHKIARESLSSSPAGFTR